MKTSFCAILLGLFVSAPALAIIWSDPVLLPELNNPITGNIGFDPFLTSDGLSVYFCRNNSDGDSRILMATRSSVSGPFTSTVLISELDIGKRIYSPWVSTDGLRMYYSRHEDTQTKQVIIMAERSNLSDPWEDVMTFTDIHDEFQYNSYHSLSPDELTIYYSAPHPDDYLIWKATRASIGEQFTNPVPVTELNDGSYSYAPYIMPDGLTIFYSAVRDGHSTRDLYMATRSSVSDPFGNIERLNISTDSYAESHPFVTADYSTLYFNTPEGIWVSYAVPEPSMILLLAAGGFCLRKKR